MFYFKSGNIMKGHKMGSLHYVSLWDILNHEINIFFLAKNEEDFI